MRHPDYKAGMLPLNHCFRYIAVGILILGYLVDLYDVREAILVGYLQGTHQNLPFRKFS
jgi:hypothetical protein